MPVYVDQIIDYRGSISAALARRAGTRWCHMTADTLEELHEMANRIDLQRSWYQPARLLHHCHYDLVPSKRELAVAHGAVEVNSLERVRQLHREGRARELAGGEA